MPARDAPTPARHELPVIDGLAFDAARAVDRLLAQATQVATDGDPADPRVAGAERWAGYFARLPDQLRDAPLPDLRAAARRARSAFGPKDSVRDVLEPDVTEPVLESIDRLLKALARHEAHRP